MTRYPDFIERLLLHEETLRAILPQEPSDYALVIRIREANDGALLGDRAPLPKAPLPLLRAGLFYYHNALDDAHRCAAEASGDIAAYWHGMVHRREGDFENARYWMRRAGQLPTFAEMHGRAGEAAPTMSRQPDWDPFLFINLCEQFRFGEKEHEREIVHLQRVEFAVLFDYVWRQCAPKE